MMKKIYKLFGVVLFCVIVYGIIIQYKVEKYITKQQKEYNILSNKERITYLPYLFYLLRDNFIFKNETIEKQYCFIPYELEGLKEFISDKDYDSYIVYCYFSKKELVMYQN